MYNSNETSLGDSKSQNNDRVIRYVYVFIRQSIKLGYGAKIYDLFRI